MCDECQLGESVGWFEFMRISFGGKTDVNKMSDDEKTALLKALGAKLLQKSGIRKNEVIELIYRGFI